MKLTRPAWTSEIQTYWKFYLGISKVPKKGTSTSPSSLSVYLLQLIPQIQTDHCACVCVCAFAVGETGKIQFNIGSLFSNSSKSLESSNINYSKKCPYHSVLLFTGNQYGFSSKGPPVQHLQGRSGKQ